MVLLIILLFLKRVNGAFSQDLINVPGMLLTSNEQSPWHCAPRSFNIGILTDGQRWKGIRRLNSMWYTIFFKCFRSIKHLLKGQFVIFWNKYCSNTRRKWRCVQQTHYNYTDVGCLQWMLVNFWNLANLKLAAFLLDVFKSIDLWHQ